MKIITSIFLFFLTQITFGQNDINGVWVDSTSSAFTNCTAIFSVQNDTIYFSHYLEFNGQPFVEHGKGIVIYKAADKATDNVGRYIYTVTVCLPIQGWSTAGIHNLELSPDGLTLRGTYSDNKGNNGPLVFKKKYPL